MSDTPKAIVFGATGGVGQALLEMLHERGWSVGAIGRDDAATRACASRFDAPFATADIRDVDEVKESLKSVAESLGGLNAVVNCTGKLLLKPAHACSLEDWHETIETNLTGAFAVLRAAVPLLRGGGSIVLISTAAARVGMPNHDIISAAKAGVEGLARAAAATYAGKGIRINCVAPGLVASKMSEALTKGETALRIAESTHPLGRIGQPSEIASAIAWLIDPANTWVTGQVIGVDGGLAHLRGRTRIQA